MEVNRNNSIAAAKKDYQQAAEKLSDQYNKQLRDVEENHQAREANQRENYLKQKEEMEETSEKQLKEYDEKLKKEVAERQQRYLKNIKNMRDANIQERNNQVANQKYELDSLRSSYKTAKEESDRLQAYEKENMEDRFTKGLTRRENHFNTKLGDIQKTNIEKMNEFRESQDLEKKYMMSEHENEKKSLIQQTNLLRNEANSRHQFEKERLRQNHDEDIEILKNNAENQVANTIKNKDIQQERQRANYEEVTKNINKRNADAFKDANIENKNDKRRLEREYSQNRMELQKELNKIASQPIEAEYIKKKEKLEDHWQERVERANDETSRVTKSAEQQIIKMSDEQKTEDARRDLIFSEKMNEKDNEIRRLRSDEIGKLRDDFKNQIDQKTAQVRTIQDEADKRDVVQKKQQQNHLDTQRQQFNKEIIKLTESKEALASELREDLAREKTQFIESARRQSHQEKADMRENMNEQFMRKEFALNKKITQLESDNKKLVDTYEKKLDVLNKKHAKEFEHYKLMQNDISAANKRSIRRDMIRMQQNFDKEKMALKNEFERKIEQAKSDSEVHIAKLTERYEGMLANERSEHQREMQRKTTMLYDELIRYKQQSDSEKATMVAQYENKMNEMEQAHRAQIEIKNTRKTIS
jgi:hypothetical protein